MKQIHWCDCILFELWYIENDIRICRCGHPDREHVDTTKLCIGDVITPTGKIKQLFYV